MLYSQTIPVLFRILVRTEFMFNCICTLTKDSCTPFDIVELKGLNSYPPYLDSYAWGHRRKVGPYILPKTTTCIHL